MFSNLASHSCLSLLLIPPTGYSILIDFSYSNIPCYFAFGLPKILGIYLKEYRTKTSM